MYYEDFKMADENIKKETNNASIENDKVGAVGRDTGLDVSSLLKANKEEPIKKETALEKMKREKAEYGGGLVVDNKELAEKNKIVVSGRVNRKYFYERIDYINKIEGG